MERELDMPNKVLANISEEDLVSMIIASDQEAFEFLYDKYHKAVFGLLFRITNDTQASETLLIDCFVAIKLRISEFNSAECRLFTWMLNLARTKVINAKKEINGNKIHTGQNYVRENEGYTPFTEKPILELVMFEGYSYDELAIIKGVTRDEIGIIIRREMNQMKKNFK